MHFQYYMQFFPGADAPGSQQPMALCRAMARRGHDVSVVSTDYNLDSGLPERPALVCEKGGGTIRTHRFHSPRGGRGDLLERLHTYVYFMATAIDKGVRLPGPDLVLGSVQPLFTGWAAMSVARRRRVPFVLEVRDLWPDALIVKGAVGKRTALPLYWMANRLYEGADRVVSLTPGIRKELLAKGLDQRKVDVFPNGFDPSLFQGSGGLRERTRRRYGWGDDFVAIFTGSFTKVTAMDVVVRAASRLKESPGIRFELFGKGPTRGAVEDLARETGARNITFHDPVPKVDVPGLLAAADVALMCLFESPLVHIYFENKFMDYMGAGKPIIASMEGEQADIIRKFDTGKVAPTFDDERLAALILEASRDRAACRRMGENGRKLVNEKLLLPAILDEYVSMLERVARNPESEADAWLPAL